MSTAPIQLTDTEREILIQYHKIRMVSAKPFTDEQRQICDQMTRLINGRSKERILSMEREQGLSVTDDDIQNNLRGIQ